MATGMASTKPKGGSPHRDRSPNAEHGSHAKPQEACRTKEIVVATTLLDAQEYPKSDLEELYGQR